MTSSGGSEGTLSLRLVGEPIALECESSSVARALRAAWRPSLSMQISPSKSYFVDAEENVFVDGVLWTGGQDLLDVVPRIERCWLESVITRHADATFLHGGGVELEGRLYVFVGDSGAGKSSFSREALRRGGTYLSDDMLVLSRDRAYGLGRSVQFDPLPEGSPLPSWLVDCDVDSYRIGHLGRKAARVPLWTADHAVAAGFDLRSAEVVVVQLKQVSSPRLSRVGALERLAFLHGASLDTARPYDGCLGWGPTYELEWVDPARELRTLLDDLERG